MLYLLQILFLSVLYLKVCHWVLWNNQNEYDKNKSTSGVLRYLQKQRLIFVSSNSKKHELWILKSKKKNNPVDNSSLVEYS